MSDTTVLHLNPSQLSVLRDTADKQDEERFSGEGDE